MLCMPYAGLPPSRSTAVALDFLSRVVAMHWVDGIGHARVFEPYMCISPLGPYPGLRTIQYTLHAHMQFLYKRLRAPALPTYSCRLPTSSTHSRSSPLVLLHDLIACFRSLLALYCASFTRGCRLFECVCAWACVCVQRHRL